jgi:hypothetical protein
VEYIRESLLRSDFSYKVFDDGFSSIKTHFIDFPIKASSSIGTFFEFFKNIGFVRAKLALSSGTFLGFW